MDDVSGTAEGSSLYGRVWRSDRELLFNPRKFLAWDRSQKYRHQ